MKEQLKYLLENLRNGHVEDDNFKAYLRCDVEPKAIYKVDIEGSYNILSFDSISSTPQGKCNLQRFLNILANQDLSGIDHIKCPNIVNDRLFNHFIKNDWIRHPHMKEMFVYSVYLPIDLFIIKYK